MRCNQRIPEGRALNSACEALFARAARWGGRPAAGRICQILKDTVKPGMKVLDIGTGPGAIPFHLKKRYSDASFTGLDISPGILQKAMRGQKGNSGPVAFLCGDGEALPFGPQTVDVILSFFALHHMDHPEHLLMEIDRVLKPGGILLMIDFRRDMAHGLYRFLNALWKTAFFFTAGRSGFEDSVQSAWLPDEMDSRLKHIGSNRFRLHANPMELWVMANIGESDA